MVSCLQLLRWPKGGMHFAGVLVTYSYVDLVFGAKMWSQNHSTVYVFFPDLELHFFFYGSRFSDFQRLRTKYGFALRFWTFWTSFEPTLKQKLSRMATRSVYYRCVKYLALALVSVSAILTRAESDGFRQCWDPHVARESIEQQHAPTPQGASQAAGVRAELQILPTQHRRRGDDVHPQLLADDRDAYGARTKDEVVSERPDALDIWITSPPNDTVFLVGDVLVTFETLGFTPCVLTPVEVLVPQNGDVPALLERGNTVSLLVDKPCTQHVILSATAGRKRISTSVMFTTVIDKATVLSSRVPLPADAVWGVPLVHEPSKRTFDGLRTNVLGVIPMDSMEDAVRHEQGAVRDKDYHWRGGQEAGQLQSTSYPEGTPRPFTIVFMGSLAWDGQKHIWLQQMEGLPRQRFKLKYLTFEKTTDESEEAVYWRETTTEELEHRLRAAGVPLIKIPSQLLRFDWTNFDHSIKGGGTGGYGGYNSSNGIERSVTAPKVRIEETVFKFVLESFDRAGGRPHLMSPPWTREVFEYIVNAVRSVAPDVLVVANSKTLGDAVLTRAARLAMHERGIIVMDFPNMDPAPSVDVDVLAAPSHYVSRHPAVRALAKTVGANVVVIPPGVDVAEPPVDGGEFYDNTNPNNPNNLGERRNNRRGFCDATTAPVIGFVGRLAPEKGPGLFLSVAAEIIKELPSTRFILAGDGPLRSVLEAMAARLGLTRQVRFIGWVGGPDLQRLMQEMDLLFNPSLASSETFCIVNIEAMAAGIPIAAFGIGGMLEYLKPGVNALVMDDPQPRAAAAAIVEAIFDCDRMEAFAERARADVEKHFRVDLALQRWTQMFEALERGALTGIPVKEHTAK